MIVEVVVTAGKVEVVVAVKDKVCRMVLKAVCVTLTKRVSAGGIEMVVIVDVTKGFKVSGFSCQEARIIVQTGY